MNRYKDNNIYLRQLTKCLRTRILKFYNYGYVTTISSCSTLRALFFIKVIYNVMETSQRRELCTRI